MKPEWWIATGVILLLIGLVRWQLSLDAHRKEIAAVRLALEISNDMLQVIDRENVAIRAEDVALRAENAALRLKVDGKPGAVLPPLEGMGVE